ncbi:MAG: Hpt domain-containing protein [Saccharofermentans sp.]|jgi:hypothetical protein|nr:Hpt domain-containing protein [Mageeibacillus sp.]MCI1263683.1 Hpt domain-containing protein [Saccharofermentans sp.]MCI1275324.1 Hpt domain-containing protein [Saccharofermentans sp.]MCI1769856.1 Hpt domain-containing protein [Mageeibacillus sp.]MCI2043695.1 Hpt domain-containing protein [Mageeibacillus sp.]
MREKEGVTEIIEGLKKWGCDIDSAMPRFGGDESFYCRLIYEVDEEKGFTELGSQLKNGYIKESFETAHMLKGVLANMEITPMYETTCRIVELLRAGTLEGTEQLYNKLISDKTVLDQILYREEA